jgi:hypothetical protein
MVGNSPLKAHGPTQPFARALREGDGHIEREREGEGERERDVVRERERSSKPTRVATGLNPEAILEHGVLRRV